MGLIDLILNLAGLLLLLSWRALRFDPLVRTSPTALVGLLKRAEPRVTKSWRLIGGLLLLLVLRAVFYWEIGSAADWTPKLHLGVVVLPFRSDLLGSALLFSILGFGKVVVVFYFWLLALALINRNTAEPDSVLKLLRLHLGRIGRWPWPVVVLIPAVGMAALWLPLHPLLAWAGVLPRAHSVALLLRQSCLLTVALVVTLKFVLPPILLLHLVASYIYLGASPVWDFIAATARHILAPLRWAPLRVGKLDLAPLAGTVLILLLLHWLPHLVESEIGKRNLALWPQ